jgi:hypothetical protein
MRCPSAESHLRGSVPPEIDVKNLTAGVNKSPTGDERSVQCAKGISGGSSSRAHRQLLTSPITSYQKLGKELTPVR